LIEKVNAKDLRPSALSPVIPVITTAEKVKVTKELNEKAKEKAKRRLDRLQWEKMEAEKAKASGEKVSGEQPAAEEPKKVPKGLKKKTEPKSQKPLEFPVSARINNYGFLNLRKGLLEALDWHKGMALVVVKNPDGSVTIRKA
jgi:hypothetical protein